LEKKSPSFINYDYLFVSMPQRNKTGPEGKGPRTGRGKGTCKPSSSQPKNVSKSTRKTKK